MKPGINSSSRFMTGLRGLVRDYKDIFIILAALLVIYSTASYFELAEGIHEFINDQESSELDELVLTVFFLFFFLFGLLFVRTKNLRKEIMRRIGFEKELEVHAGKLKENEARFKSLVEHSHDLIIETNHNGIILFANRNHESLGYVASELVGTSIFDYIHPDDLERATREYKNAIYNMNSTNNVVLRYRHKSGGWRWIESIGKPYITADGELKGVITSRDITDRKLIQDEILENKERYRTLVENSYDIIVEADSLGRFSYINSKFSEFLGYSSDDVMNRDIFCYMHEEDKPRVMVEFSRAVSQGTPGHAVYRYMHKNGEWRWIESAGNTYKTSSGQTVAVIASRDITERKKMDEEMSRAQRLESLGILAGGIAHDFNNILTIVLGGLGLARMNMQRDDDIDVILDDAEAATKRATGLTQQLLTFAKGGAPNKKTLHINKLLRDSALFALTGSNILPRFFISDDLEPVDVDEGQINQVINNLIINAKQAMPAGGELRVAAANTVFRNGNSFNLPEGKYVKIDIQDYGCGIEKEFLHKIFDPFFTTKESGNGLGLATSYSIIKKHGGHITADSLPDSGTTMSVFIPASKNYAMPQEGTSARSVHGGRGNLLIMEDEDAVAAVLGAITRRLGYTPVITENSRTAVNTYKSYMESGNVFDAVILDLTIPGDIGGKETLNLLKEIDPEVKAIITSGYFSDGPITGYLDHGFKAYVRKPYNITDIGETLDYVISGIGNSVMKSEGNKTA